MTDVKSDIARGWLHEADCRLADMVAIVEQTTEQADNPHAATIDHNTVVYDCDHLRSVISDPDSRLAVQAELAHAFLEGPGIIAFQRAFADTTIIDRATTAFQAMIAVQHASGQAAGDLALSTHTDGRLEVFMRGADNCMWHRWHKKPMGDWNDWTSEGGPILSDLGVGRNKDGRMEVFGLNHEGAMVHSWVQK